MVVIAMMRGVNVGGTGKLPMEAWRRQLESLGCTGVRTYIQSGNAVFTTREKNLAKLAGRIEDAVEREFGFRRPAILRSAEDFQRVAARQPFPAPRDPAKLVVYFLAAPITDDVRRQVRQLAEGFAEEIVAGEHELFLYFPDGQGRTKLPLAKIERALGVACTARNWNTVLKLAELATPPAA